MSEDQGSEDGAHVYGPFPADTDTGRLLAEALVRQTETHVPTTLDYRLKAMDVLCGFAAQHALPMYESVDALLEAAGKMEKYLREN